MAAPGKQSRWGSLLSQAVAGVESRLDTILTDADESEASAAASTNTTTTAATKTTTTTTSTNTAPKSPSKQPTASSAIKAGLADSRSSSRNRVNDRLQARLAQAMAGKASSASAANSSSRATTSSPRSSTDQARPSSIEQQRKPTVVDTKEASASAADKPQHDATSHELNAAGSNGVVCSTSESPDDVLRAGTIEAGPAAGREPKENITTIRPDVNGESEVSQEDQHGSQTVSGDEVKLPRSEQDPSEVLANADNPQNQQQSELIKELQALSDRQQQEIQDYVERVDSLESKLQYLSRTATEAAKKAASSAPSGSAEQKLAEKDEKIALLMEEGQKLSSNEHKLRATTKKLRALLGENEKQIADLKTKRDKAISDAEALRSRLDGSEETSRATAALRREIDALKRENVKKDDAHRRLDQEWTKKMDQAEASHRDALNKALAAERQKQKTLEEANASLAAEKEAAAEQARQDEIEWREKLERAHERARKTETELKTELLATEGKLEAMRVAAEEASSGSGGDAQVKMFRQMETLQSQYAAARQNWQGIEASLLAKLGGLEKERDEAQRRESEMRRKARDAAVRLRRLEDELHDVQPALISARQELDVCRDEMAKLQASYTACQVSLAEAREEADRLKREIHDGNDRNDDKEGRVGGEEGDGDGDGDEDSVEAQRRHWVDAVAGATATNRDHQSRPESPLLSISRTCSSDLLGLGISGPGKSRRCLTPGSVSEIHPTDIVSPLLPPMSSRRIGVPSSTRTRDQSHAGSGPPPTPFSPFEPASETGQFPYPAALDRENGGVAVLLDPISSSPRHTVAQDMISVSTVAAGPSVQLVERMSAAIRRLEAEKVTAKEEMARVCGQRDEARTDLVALMKEIAELKATASRVPDLEQEVASLDARYQTTLEMLGEKSELVEELRADVEDVKAMYRELVERTVK
ncbi:hypothetical protein E4U43_007702 [Claviceps pusilla]|uniref:TATA element modulatory factor 1 TATA binding domain-containing protein n=1 Tax=Claviceps pusilla TaxID=123648 RepID=A0A9P7NEI3_9HYPO|nr:hypothetical protein E4U43_007702 [Claviceps pusilla]